MNMCIRIRLAVALLMAAAWVGCNPTANGHRDHGCTELDTRATEAQRQREAAQAKLESARAGLAVAEHEQARAKAAQQPADPGWWRPAWTDVGRSQAWCQASAQTSASMARMANNIDARSEKKELGPKAAALTQPPPTACTDPGFAKRLKADAVAASAELTSWSNRQRDAEQELVRACRAAQAK